MSNFLKKLFGINKEADKEVAPNFVENTIETIKVPDSIKISAESSEPDFTSEVIVHEVTEELVKDKLGEIPEEKSQSDLYEPTLDLRDYKYPSIEILENTNSKNWFYQFVNRKSDSPIPVMWSLNNGNVILKDLASIKNILIVGTQSTGKTTFINQLILSLLFSKHPALLKMVLIDPKKIEFNIYSGIEKHFLAKLPGDEVIVTNTKKVIHTLNALCIEIDNRFDLLEAAGARTIDDYNDKFVHRWLNPEKGHQYLPYIVLFIDDLSMLTLSGGNEVNAPLIRLVNEGYRVGLFNVIGTSQFLNNTLDSNLVSLIRQRVVFRLNNKEDYRRFFDTVKLNRFIKDGDFLYNDDARIIEGINLNFNYLDIEKVVQVISIQRGYNQAFLLPEYIDEKDLAGKDFDLSDRDSLFDDAARLIVQSQSGSTSLLQRRMKLGFNRANRLMDQLEAAGIVGPNQGSKVRDVLIKTEADLQQQLNALG